MKAFLPFIIVGFLVGLCSLQPVGVLAHEDNNPEDIKLQEVFKAYLEEEFKHRPMMASRLGDHRFDHLLDDISPEARAANLQRAKELLAKMPSLVDYDKLSRSAQIDFEIWKHSIETSIWMAENFDPYVNDPRTYNGYFVGSIYQLLTQSSLPKETNVRNCVARMRFIPRAIEIAKKTLGTPPKVYVETAIKQNQGAIAFYSSSIYQLSGETPRLSDISKAAQPIIESLKSYQEFLEKELLPRAEGDWRIGKEKFAKKLDYTLDAGLTADEILAEAEKEAARVTHELYVLSKQKWSTLFPDKRTPPDDPAGRSQTIRTVLAELAKAHGKPDELVYDARQTVDEIKKFIAREDILGLPEPDACKIIEMPEFQRGNAVAYLNSAPPLDTKAGSFYAISPPPRDWDDRRRQSYLEEYNSHMLKILTIHEAYPGHYVQLEYSNRHPSLIRRILTSGVFAEGWAVYTEQMMLDEGFGNGDIPLRLHQLKFYLRAVLNAILDHKMHCSNMTDDEALDLLVKRGFQSEGEAMGKLIRSKQSSCQLSTYFVGRTAFYRLRQSVQRKQGDNFNLGRFHEAVMSHGTLPVKYLPELVQ